VQRWLSVAAGQLASGPAAARVAVLFRRPIEQAPRDAAARLFALMQSHLAAQPFLAAPHPTIADVALYTYTAHAPEGGVSLEPYPQCVRGWRGSRRCQASSACSAIRRSKRPPEGVLE
jgi:glutathione S-transferase